MGVVTWDGSASTDYGTAANWDTGVVPSASSNVVIPDTSSINNCILDTARTVNSFRIDANGTFDGNGNLLTVDSEGDATTGASEGFAVNIDGIISGTDTDIAITTPATTKLDIMGSSGNIRNLIINHASCDAFLEANTSINGNLTISTGKLTCTTEAGDARTLTVTGTTIVGPDSGGADQATLTATSQDLVLGSGKTDGAGLNVKTGGTFVGGSGTHTIGSIVIDNNAAAKFTNTSGTATLNGHSNDNTRTINIGGSSTCVATGTMDLTYGTASNIQCGNAAGIGNLTLTGNVTYTQSNSLLMTGNLTITSGTTLTTSGSNYALTVGGGIKNTGTLTANASTIIITGEVAGFAFDQMGTFNAGTSTIQIGDGSTSTVGSSTHFKTNNCHNLIINQHIDAPNGNVAWRVYTGTELTIGGNLTVTRGRFYRNTSTQDLTVTGDVNIASVGKLGTSSASGSNTFGSLTIAGTYQATSGTTTINGVYSSPFALNNSGTFTHNDGTLLLNRAGGNQDFVGTWDGSSALYNLTIDGNGGTKRFRQNMLIEGDLDVTASDTFTSALNTETLTVNGDVNVSGTLGATTQTGAYTFGGIRINSGGTYLATSGTTTVTNRFTGTSNLWKNDSGTFTHNNGTVKFTDNDHSLVKEAGSFYNFEQASSLGDYAILWETGGGGSCTILNNLTITRGDFEIHAAGDTLDIHGQTILNGSSNSGARFNNDKNQTGTITHHGLVTIIQGTYHVEDGATVNMAGIRNVGGVVD